MEQDTQLKTEAPKTSLLKNKWVRSGALVAAVLIVAAGLLYWQMTSTRVGIDNSLVSAPTIDLSATAPGTLNDVYVNVGDQVPAGTVVAQVGDELIKTKVAGLIISTQNDIGKSFNPGQAVVSMVDPQELRVVGTIEENKGLSKIQVGQKANFTVDAFGSKVYSGIVDQVSPTANQSSVVFNISDQRATQDFDIKVRFNPAQYPELKNGMSAKLTIFTK